MYCLIQLYVTISANLAPQKPLLKLFSIKAVGEYSFFPTKLHMHLLIQATISISDLLASNISVTVGDFRYSQECEHICLLS